MSAQPVSIPQSSTLSGELVVPRRKSFTEAVAKTLVQGLKRRWQRERRRRAVGRAYDMALEIARVVPPNSRVLDIGCGNGFIAHHLSAMLRSPVLGIDLMNETKAPIAYRRYAGSHFPVTENRVDTVLLCYVLHHAPDLGLIMREVSRVLRRGGLAIVYEDIPRSWWDRVVCWSHDVQWRGRTGRCTFRRESEWLELFASAGFEIVSERALSRWRNLTHPVSRRFYVLRSKGQRAKG